jgi:hypothetical protein
MRRGRAHYYTFHARQVDRNANTRGHGDVHVVLINAGSDRATRKRSSVGLGMIVWWKVVVDDSVFHFMPVLYTLPEICIDWANPVE